MEDNTFLSDNELRDIWRNIAEYNLEWGDVDSQFEGLQPGLANIYCPFHDNKHSPAARPYWDEDRDVLTIFCFRERRSFSVYDYIDLILCRERRIYKDPGEYLQKHFGEVAYKELFQLARQSLLTMRADKFDQKCKYIRNLYNEYDNVVDFINALYTENN